MKTRKIVKELEALKEEFSIVSMSILPKRDKPFLKFETLQAILKSGDIVTREKLIKGSHSGSASVVVPITKDFKSLVIVQPRVFKNDPVGVEVPAGYLDPGETPKEAALRELIEETGYVAEELIELKTFYQDQGISEAVITCFLALGCEEKQQQNLDEDEYIKYMKCSLNDLYYLVDAGIINDANGIIAIGEAKKYLNKLKKQNKTKGD